MKRYFIFACALVSVLVIMMVYESNEINKVKYASLSEDEMNRFVSERNIEPLAVEHLDQATIILVDGGVYTLSKKSNSEELVASSTKWGNTLGEVQLGFQQTGSPYVHLILDDPTLIDRAHKVEVIFSDGKSVSELVKDQRGFLLFYDKEAENLTIRDFELHIYDENNNILYEKNA